ncbi:MAG: hypothetical protein WC059_01865 [Candidatus Paceibacterota bacterium]
MSHEEKQDSGHDSKVATGLEKSPLVKVISWVGICSIVVIIVSMFFVNNGKDTNTTKEESEHKEAITRKQTFPMYWNEYCDLKAPGDSRIFENPDPDHYHIHTFGYGKKYDYVAGSGSTKTAGGSSLSTEEADYITLTYTSEPCRIRVLFQKNGTCEYCKN